MPVNRIVAFFLKPILTLLFAAFAAWLTRQFPGLDWDGVPGLDSEAAAAAEVAASGVAFAVTGWATHKGIDKWLDGWQAYEERSAYPSESELAAQYPGERGNEPTVSPGTALNVEG